MISGKVVDIKVDEYDNDFLYDKLRFDELVNSNFFQNGERLMSR